MPHVLFIITTHGDPNTVPGKIGNAVTLNGHDQYVAIANR